MLGKLLRGVQRSDSRTAKWNIFFNYSSIVYNVIIAIALVPLYLKYIPSDLYGLWLATGNILTWITLLDPGLGGTMQYKIAHAFGKSDKPEIGRLIGNSLIIACLYFLVLACGAMYLQFNILNWINIESVYQQEFMLALVLTSLSTIIMVFSFNLQGINFGLQTSLGIGIVFTVMNIAGIVSTIYYLHNGYGLLAFGYSGMIRAFIYLGGNIGYLFLRMKFEQYRLSFDKGGIKELFNLLAYGFLGKTAGTLQGRIFEFLIAKYVSHSAVTSFKISLSAPDNCKLILIRPSISISPVLSKLHGTGETELIKRRLKQMVYFVIWAAMFIFSAFFVFNRPFIKLWVGDSFYIGDVTNVLICIFVVVASISEILAQFVWAIGEIKKNSFATTIQFVLFLPMSIWACVHHGIEGLLVASILSYFAVTIWYFTYVLVTKLSIKVKSVFPFLFESLLVVLASIAVVELFKNISILGWGGFLLNCGLFTLAYTVAVFLLSKKFRNLVSALVMERLINRFVARSDSL